MNRVMHKRFTWLVFLCLLGPLAQANDSNDTAGRGYYIATEIGVKAIDYFPLPVEQPAGVVSGREAQLSTPIAALSGTFTLHSCPGATKVIYLDFDGHYGLEGGGIYYAPFNFEGPDSTFSAAELTEIQLAWQSVAEDFLPFNVDVTTEDPGVEALRNMGGSDIHWGIRVVVSPSNWDYSWAYPGSFNWDSDYECQAYTGDNTWIWIADSASHEVGHALGLSHDGGGGDGEYYEGHGSGLTHWSPIMGWSGYELSQWSIGEYAGADNQEDDLTIITTQNGFGYRTDDHGSATGTATAIDVDHAILELVEEGIIERTNDVDYFLFTMPGDGDVQFEINPDNLAANLDIRARLHDGGGVVLFTSNPTDSLHANFDVSLSAGNYYLSIDGAGLDDPLGPPADGYSDYGCLGYYSVAAMSDYSTSVAFADGNATAPLLRFIRRPATPFATSNTFSFALPGARHVGAHVFDVRGRLVETLIDRGLAAGMHTISWEPASRGAVAAGLYFVRIEAGGETIIAKTVHLP